jgi:hypothetical protein
MIWKNGNHEAHKQYFLRGLRGLRGSIFNVVANSAKSDFIQEASK